MGPRLRRPPDIGLQVGSMSVPVQQTSAAASPPRPREALSKSPLLSGVVLAFVLGGLVAAGVLFAGGGWDYYAIPLELRGRSPLHKVLRPSGFTGHLLGIAGTLFLLSTLPYVARKRVKWLAGRGSIMNWLEVHIFCGIFGPILITLHTSLKFNGIISVAYWSMVLVVLSGFVGRHLYVRIPKTMRGNEVSRVDLEQRASELRERLTGSAVPPTLVRIIDETETRLMVRAGTRSLVQRIADALRMRRTAAALRREVRAAGLDSRLLHEVLEVIHMRAVLLDSIANLKRSKELFKAWHVFHRPLVWLMFVIAALHVGVAVYFGYAFFGK